MMRVLGFQSNHSACFVFYQHSDFSFYLFFFIIICSYDISDWFLLDIEQVDYICPFCCCDSMEA